MGTRPWAQGGPWAHGANGGGPTAPPGPTAPRPGPVLTRTPRPVARFYFAAASFDPIKSVFGWGPLRRAQVARRFCFGWEQIQCVCII